MYDKSTKFLLFLFLTVVFKTPCFGAFTSNYGQITNVQAYSSNPYYNQNGMYNQGFPRPVYAQGTDLGSGDCENIITAVIADYCSTRNKCNGLRLSDVRPGIMVALSQMPNHNYITSCYGFLDGAFDKYIESNPQSVQRVNQNINVPQLPKESFPQVPKWKQEYDERSRELENLQKQNDDNNGDLTQTDFPKGIADVSFQERIKNTAEDMQNYKDMKAYYTLDVNLTKPNTKQPQNKESNNTKESSNPESNNEQDIIIQNIVSALDPTTKEARVFLTDLVTSYVKDDEADMLDDSFVYNFLSEGNNLEKYKGGLVSLNGTAQDIDSGIDLNWEDIKMQVSTVLDASLRLRGALVCENNRSYEVGIDTALWVATAAAAIASFGAGGVAVAGGRAAIGTGLKALAKGASKVGLKSASKAISKQGSKQLTKAAVKTGFKKTGMKGWTTYQGKGLAKHITKKAGENLATKRGILLASGAVTGAIYETLGTSAIANNTTSGLLYSLVSSDVSTDIINCQDLDYKNKCYAICGQGSAQDDLNTKVFNPILGESYCINAQNYTLYSIKTGKPLLLNSDDYIKITQKIRSDVIDKGHCDWNEDDVDMYIGSYIYDPDTLEPSSNLIIEEVIRLDD